MSGGAQGAPPIGGSRKAKQHAAGILSAISGSKTTGEACEMMQISLTRYYQLETRALAGMVAALEPRPRGRTRTPEGEIRELRKENARLSREVSRTQSLLRAAHRTLGLRSTTRPKKGGKRRNSKPTRAKKAMARLVVPEEDGGEE